MVGDRSTGFSGDGSGGQPLLGLFEGEVVARAVRGRVRVAIPGVIEEQSAWARPATGGSKAWGSDSAPPIGATVFVMFLAGDPDSPVYWPGDHGVADGASEAFPENEDPDVHVWGRGPFRLVVDDREGRRAATMKAVRVVNGEEQDICWLTFNYEMNSVQLYATSALGLSAGALVDVDCAGDVQVRGRKVLPSQTPI